MVEYLLTAPIELKEDWTIDLRNKTLKVSENLFSDYPDATAAIKSTYNLTIKNGTIYGPELRAAVQKYIVEFMCGTEENKFLSIESVTLESNGAEYAVHVKDGAFYSSSSSIKGGFALKFEAQNKYVRGHLIDSHIEGGVDFLHNHVENDFAFMSGIFIEGNTNINGDLSRGGTYRTNILFDMKGENKPVYNYSNITGDGWFQATKDCLQYQLSTTGLVDIEEWELKSDVTFDVNKKVNDKIIRFYVAKISGSGTITFNNTNEGDAEQELYLDIDLKSENVEIKYNGSFKVQDLNKPTSEE